MGRNNTLSVFAGPDHQSARAPSRKNLGDEISRLKDLSAALAVAADALELTGDRNISLGVDFYQEVRRLEITLIRQALAYAGGSQIRAAKLLKMNHTTLNSKIKSYGIPIP